MKQVLQYFRTGVISVEDVPKPSLKSGCVLVRNRASLISKGTEGGRVRLGKKSLFGKARERPEQVKKVLQALRTEGLLATANAVKQTLDVPLPMGYSCSGTVAVSADDVKGFKTGTPVACGGAGMASHADYVVVPQNLCVPLPVGVSFREGAFATVGAIAMQGIRIADVRLGEKVVVIGLGLVGLLTVELLKASGCRVLGVDIDPKQVAWVEEQGICATVERNAGNIYERVLEFCGGYGADAVIITAAVNSNDPVALAGDIARSRGRVVVLGRTVMDAPRETYLFKELQLLTSYAYGPGTEDPTYETEGYDYPVAYVPWTAKRNMACFLNLISEKKIHIDPLITHTYPINEAPAAFDMVSGSTAFNVGVILEYRGDDSDVTQVERKTGFTIPREERSEQHLRVGIIGAGSFATNVMLPHIKKRKDLSLKAIVSSTGIKAAALAKKYGISRSGSVADEIIEAPDVDCVMIFTRHGTHASFAEKALLAGKHVFVEKPVALTEDELQRVVSAQAKSGKVLMIGFNRRFSPLATRVRDFFSDRIQPMVIEYRGNVGYRPPEHWLHHPVDGGGVILGEACHYIDFCRWMVNSSITHVDAKCIGDSDSKIVPEDNAAINLRFEDGSMANILYVSNGARGYSRERCEIHADARSGLWEDFKYIKLVRDLSLPKTKHNRLFRQKGFKEELDSFFGTVGKARPSGMEWLNGQLDSSLAAIKAAKRIRGE